VMILKGASIYECTIIMSTWRTLRSDIGVVIYLILYVDEMLIICNNNAYIEKIKVNL